jgi:hypothetical protein
MVSLWFTTLLMAMAATGIFIVSRIMVSWKNLFGKIILSWYVTYFLVPIRYLER